MGLCVSVVEGIEWNRLHSINRKSMCFSVCRSLTPSQPTVSHIVDPSILFFIECALHFDATTKASNCVGIFPQTTSSTATTDFRHSFCVAHQITTPELFHSSIRDRENVYVRYWQYCGSSNKTWEILLAKWMRMAWHVVRLVCTMCWCVCSSVCVCVSLSLSVSYLSTNRIRCWLPFFWHTHWLCLWLEYPFAPHFSCLFCAHIIAYIYITWWVLCSIAVVLSRLCKMLAALFFFLLLLLLAIAADGAEGDPKHIIRSARVYIHSRLEHRALRMSVDLYVQQQQRSLQPM